MINVSIFILKTLTFSPEPKSTFRHLKLSIQKFHRKYIWVPADKAANNVVVVWQLHYFNTLKQELSGTKAYEETSEVDKSVVFGHCNDIALKFSVNVKEQQDKLPTMYWLRKLHIFIAGRPKAALLFWFFVDFRCGALLFVVIHVIYKYKNR